MVTAYSTHLRFVEHDLVGHPEHAGRIRALWRALEAGGLLARMTAVPVEPANDEQIGYVHTADYIALLHKLSSLKTTARLDPDTYVTPSSIEVARLAAGAVLAGVDAILRKNADNALAAVRPPGHHAEPGVAMGFCLLGNIAMAARYAQRAHGVGKVMIVDYDVHHGNGTEAMFYDDPSVLFVSIHQGSSPAGGAFYPGTGRIYDVGTGRGIGTTLNIPLPPGHGDASYAAILEQIVLPAGRRFAPDLLLVSAGFDAHWLDPLAGIRLSLTGYAAMTKALIELAKEVCGGRVAFIMEGGYNLEALGNGVANIARLLLGDNDIADPLGPAQRSNSPDVSDILREVRAIHRM